MLSFVARVEFNWISALCTCCIEIVPVQRLSTTAKLHTYQCSCNVEYVASYVFNRSLAQHTRFYVTHQYCAIDKPALMQRFPLYSLYQTHPHTRYCDDSKKAVAALPQEEFAHYRLSREFRNFSVKPRWRTVV